MDSTFINHIALQQIEDVSVFWGKGEHINVIFHVIVDGDVEQAVHNKNYWGITLVLVDIVVIAGCSKNWVKGIASELARIIEVFLRRLFRNFTDEVIRIDPI